MNKTQWKKKIKDACQAAGTYQPFFDAVIDTLAGIMETRDEAAEKFAEMGGSPVVKHTNKGGATNIVKHPALVVLMDCNAQALAYWRDLGLTPAGLKRIDENLVRPKKKSFLAEVIKDLDG